DSPRRPRGQCHALFRSHARTAGADHAGADRPGGSAGDRANQSGRILERHRDQAGDDAVVRPAVPALRSGLRPVAGTLAADAQEQRHAGRGSGGTLTRTQMLRRLAIVGGIWTLLNVYVGAHVLDWAAYIAMGLSSLLIVSFFVVDLLRLPDTVRVVWTVVGAAALVTLLG